MPRVAKIGNDKRRIATAKWRESLVLRKRPEVDAVDAAIAAAVAVYSHVARTEGNEKDRARAEALERMSINCLISRGYDPEHALRTVKRRLYRPSYDGLLTATSIYDHDPRRPAQSQH